ncbi:sensor histidine kinase [Streptomyces sp. NPDC092369]|uniref:sensor histidine kinase n=1 Tax=Streptomyces sp. NPDC092369 TaxID=3366015 RepID=UPI0037F43F51
MRASAYAEWAAVRRARLRISLITGGIITLLVTMVGGVAQAAMTHAQSEQVQRELRYGAAHGDLSSPPVCTWLYAPDAMPLANAPAGFPVRTDMERVRRDRAALERTVRRNGTVYLVRTQARADGDVVQAVFDMRYQLADRRYLWSALGVAEVVGLIAAAVTGAVLGRRAVAPLAEALARQRRFVADASHELQTPITQVYTRAQILSRQAAAADLPARHREGLARLVGSAGRLGEVLDDLLLSASLAADPARQSELRPVELVGLARSVVADESDHVKSSGLTVDVHAPPYPLIVRGVESALRRAVGELLVNAIGHTPDGGRVEVHLAHDRGQVELTVSDTGSGFEPADAERLFERFHRGEGGGRYGLGLALLREVVAHHGGAVVATGRPGRGARFTIRLPELPSAAPDPARAVTRGRSWRAGVPRPGRRHPVDDPPRPRESSR